jgi:butyryl-CoA dehydrogenase
LGGYGYCDDFPLEQYYRDARIHPLHEGTTGIQALDLLGRKVVKGGGKAVMVFLAELQAALQTAGELPPLARQVAAVEHGKERLETVLQHLSGLALGGEVDLFLADATLFLELFGIVAVGWLWLRQATLAQQQIDGGAAGADAAFYRRKLATAHYYCAYELPKVDGLARRLLDSDGLTLRPTEELFA